MITSLPAVQHSCKSAWRHTKKRAGVAKWLKVTANHRHRRFLNRITGRMCLDSERFYDEGFSAPSLSYWDVG
jgi:hypothetical protein